ncbi:hypothetical protein BpHYR1_017101 [Brachionus plicatilis]|uniref:Uncharacterized protein n=1 Tax=Brachionus plicatilis TaxID=10195 RepID=A0A3M7RTR5_BRAPC|nr:hypothetical protein BpHYR1_017101 [Brachionus plicatilis]
MNETALFYQLQPNQTISNRSVYGQKVSLKRSIVPKKHIVLENGAVKNNLVLYSADLKSGFLIIILYFLKPTFLNLHKITRNLLVKLLDQLYLEEQVQNIFLCYQKTKPFMSKTYSLNETKLSWVNVCEKIINNCFQHVDIFAYKSSKISEQLDFNTFIDFENGVETGESLTDKDLISIALDVYEPCELNLENYIEQ